MTREGIYTEYLQGAAMSSCSGGHCQIVIVSSYCGVILASSESLLTITSLREQPLRDTWIKGTALGQLDQILFVDLMCGKKSVCVWKKKAPK